MRGKGTRGKWVREVWEGAWEAKPAEIRACAGCGCVGSKGKNWGVSGSWFHSAIVTKVGV